MNISLIIYYDNSIAPTCHSFRENAYKLASEPKELYIVSGVNHSHNKLTGFFNQYQK